MPVLSAILAFLANHKALIAALAYALALALSNQPAVAIGVAVAALSGGVRSVPAPPQSS